MEPNMEPNVQNQQAPSPEPNPQNNPQPTPEQQAKQKRKNRWLTVLIISIGVLVFISVMGFAIHRSLDKIRTGAYLSDNYIPTDQERKEETVDKIIKNVKEEAKEGFTSEQLTSAVSSIAFYYASFSEPTFYSWSEGIVRDNLYDAARLEQGYKNSKSEIGKCGKKLGKNAFAAISGVYTGKRSVDDEETQKYLAEVKECILFLNQNGLSFQLQEEVQLFPPKPEKKPEPNTNGMADQMIRDVKTKIMAGDVTEEDLTEAVSYVISNYPDYFVNNEMMEQIIYYGALIDYTYQLIPDNESARNLEKIGYNATQAARNVYVGRSIESDSVQTSLNRIKKTAADMDTDISWKPLVQTPLEERDYPPANPDSNTKEMVDYLGIKAKLKLQNEGLTSTEQDEALSYIAENYSNCWNYNDKMEQCLYYGILLRNAYSEDGDGYDDYFYFSIGDDVVETIIYVYYGNMRPDSENVTRYKDGIAKNLKKVGYILR